MAANSIAANSSIAVSVADVAGGGGASGVCDIMRS